jgi:hypothetical protein
MKASMHAKVRSLLGNVMAVLIAACATALSTGCATQTGAPAADAAPPAAAIPRAVQPLTLEITQDGEIGRATDANGTTVPSRGSMAAMPGYFTEGAKRYQLGTGTMARLGTPAVTSPAGCVQEQGRPWYCWPRDKSAWLQVNSKGLQQVYYVSEHGQSVRAGPPAGAAPTATAGKEFSFARGSQATGGPYQAPRAVFEATGSCPCCMDGICWDPWPQCS